MILIDVNLLIYAVNSDMPQHQGARRWLEGTLSGNESVGLAWVVIFGFLRIATRGDVFHEPLTADRALGYVDEWLRQPCARPIGPGDKHWEILSNLLQVSGTAGNLSTDAHIAALAIENGATVFSADSDFKRFAGLKHINPLEQQP